MVESNLPVAAQQWQRQGLKPAICCLLPQVLWRRAEPPCAPGNAESYFLSPSPYLLQLTAPLPPSPQYFLPR